MRVTGGALRGRRLRVPAGRSVRPTTDRVRESLFAIAGSLEGARVLDLYAGSGALGIEALSRGAEHVDFVEQGAAALACLRANVAQLGLAGRTRIHRGRVLRVLARWLSASPAATPPGDAGGGGQEPHAASGAPFDLVLLDPPYASEEASEVLARLGGATGATLLRPGALVVLEAGRRHPPGDPPGLAVVDRRTYGDTLLLWYQRADGPGGAGCRGRGAENQMDDCTRE